MPNRNTAPDFINPDRPEILLPFSGLFGNNIRYFLYRKQEWEVSRLLWCIPGGTAIQQKKMASAFTSRLLTEGTKNKTSAQIADFIDYFGAFLDVRSDEHYTYITLYSLSEHLKTLFPLLTEIIQEAVFPTNEFEIELQNTVQDFLISNEKVASVSRRIFPSLIFGKDHPYGRYAELEDFEALKAEDLVSHYRQGFDLHHSFFVFSGNVTDEDIACIDEELKNCTLRRATEEPSFDIKGSAENIHHIEKEDALQTAIRIGQQIMLQSDEDFPAFVMANTILGGYFGSRLMSNIREKKGLTYGIGSAINSRKLAAYAAIITEVKAENTRQAIDEIFLEINRLMNEKIPDEEMNLVRNYIVGSGLKGFDGPMQLAERFSNMMVMDIDYSSYYQRFFKEILSVDEEKVRQMIRTYFHPDNMKVFTVGKK